MFTLNCKGSLLTIDRPIIMGILNFTDDSFYSGSRFQVEKNILPVVEKMLHDGASVIDIGGQSSRPGAATISASDECTRIISAIKLIHQNFPDVILSVDTFYGEVAEKAIAAGASIINDISGGTLDAGLMDTVANLQVPYILMHMRGNPQTMQQNPVYENVVKDVLDFFIKKIELLRSKGIKDIIIDPGFGFGKTNKHNFQLLRNLSVFKMLDCPILLGVSRKGTIYNTLKTDAEHALNGTTVLHTIGLLNGANILRAHDVKEAMETVKLVSAYND